MYRTVQIKWRLSDEPIGEDEDEELRDPETRKKLKCTIFFGYTSNMISCGVREVIRFLAQHRMVRQRRTKRLLTFAYVNTAVTTAASFFPLAAPGRNLVPVADLVLPPSPSRL